MFFYFCRKRRQELGGCDGKWGIFAMGIPGRVGYQCSNFYRKLIERREVQDPNYALDEAGKVRYLKVKVSADMLLLFFFNFFLSLFVFYVFCYLHTLHVPCTFVFLFFSLFFLRLPSSSFSFILQGKGKQRTVVHKNSTTDPLGGVNALQRGSSPSKYIAVPAPRPKVVKATVRMCVCVCYWYM